MRLCKRIQLSKTPRGYKEHMVVASGLSGAIFGAPITHVPLVKWKKLRTAMAQSLRLATAGASSWLSMGCTVNDPQLKSLGYTLNFWKRFLSMFPNMIPKFINNMQRVGRTQVGPIACLKKTLKDAGWKVVSHTVIQHTITKHQINWQNASKKHLRFVLERQWCYTVAHAVEHRKDWQPGAADIHLFSKTIRKRSFRDIWILRTAASGKHYTNDIISKYTNNVQATCPFCDKRDSKEHRLWVCSAFADIRAQYNATLRKVQRQKSNLGIYALPPLQDPIYLALPCRNDTFGPVVIPDESLVNQFLFLDGTAYGQEYCDLTVSAWAVVEADFNQHNFYTRDKGFVPGGDQSSYRGEVVAILKGLDIMYRGTMYTDCAAALTIFNKLQIAKTDGQNFPLVDHADLWSLVWEHLCGRPNHSVNLVKVKSHQDESTVTDPHERWKAAGNNFVDREAKSVVIEHQIYGQVTAAVHRRKQLVTVTVSYHDYICKIADRSFHLLKDKKKCARKEAEQHMGCPDFSNLIPRRVQPPSGLISWEDLPLRCPYGEVFYRRFSDWYGTIHWPVDAAIGVMGFVSLLELYFNFVVSTGTESPVSTASRGKPANYKLLDEDILLQTKTWSLSQHTRVWCLFWGWCLKHNVFDHPPVKTSNHFLEHVGYSLQSVCLVGRPQMMHSEATYRAMWDYFHQPEGRRKTTSAPLRPLPKRSLTIWSAGACRCFTWFFRAVSWECSAVTQMLVSSAARLTSTQVESRKPSYIGIILDHYKDPVFNQPVFHEKYMFFFSWLHWILVGDKTCFGLQALDILPWNQDLQSIGGLFHPNTSEIDASNNGSWKNSNGASQGPIPLPISKGLLDRKYEGDSLVAGGRQILGRSLDFEAFWMGTYHKKWRKNHLPTPIHPRSVVRKFIVCIQRPVFLGGLGWGCFGGMLVGYVGISKSRIIYSFPASNANARHHGSVGSLRDSGRPLWLWTMKTFAKFLTSDGAKL